MKKVVTILLILLCLVGCGQKNGKNENSKETLNGMAQTEGQTNVENVLTTVDNSVNSVDKKLEDVSENDKVINSQVDNPQKNEDKKPEVKEEEKSEPKPEKKPEPEVVYEEGIDVGKKAIDFEVELLSGEKVKLSSFKGKPIFLNFWATWCGPCVGEMPTIEKMKNEYGDKLVVLAVNCGDDIDDVKGFIKRKGFTFNVAVDSLGNISNTYDTMYIPLSLFIDKNGVIQERSVGALSESKMRENIEKVLNK